MTHWAETYIGLPWVAGDSDCWSLARRVWADHFARRVSVVAVDPACPFAGRRALREADMSDWAATGHPVEGDAVLMARGMSPCHVGIWLQGDLVLHSVEGAGVICTPRTRLASTGYSVAGVYRWTGPEGRAA